MAIVSDAVLKSAFESGDLPSPDDFINLIDSKTNSSDLSSATAGKGDALIAVSGATNTALRLDALRRYTSPEEWMDAATYAAWLAAPTTTDVTTAVQAAMDSASTTGSTVWFDEAVYLTDTLYTYKSGGNVAGGSANYAAKPGRIILRGSRPGTVNDSLGSRLQHIDGSAGPLLKMYGDWLNDTGAPSYVFAPGGGVVIENMVLEGGNSTTWVIDANIMADLGFSVRNSTIISENNAAGNGVRMDSCYNVTMDNVRIFGSRNGGTDNTGVGFQITSVSDDDDYSVNQTVLTQVDVYRFGTGVLIGETDTTGTNNIGPVSFRGGQAHGLEYGVVVGRNARQITFSGHHIEGYSKTGLVINNNARQITYRDGSFNGSELTDNAANWDVSIGYDDLGTSPTLAAYQIKLEGVEFKQCNRGIRINHADSATPATVQNVALDRLIFNPIENASTGIEIAANASQTATIYLGNQINYQGISAYTFTTNLSDTNKNASYLTYSNRWKADAPDNSSAPLSRTIDVTGKRNVYVAPQSAANPVTYTDFTGDVDGQVIFLTFTTNFAQVVIQHNASFILTATGANYTPTSEDEVLIFQNWGGVWRQVNLAQAAASVTVLTDSTTGTANDTVTDVGGGFVQATLNNNFADLTAKINAVITALKAAHIMK